MQVVNKAILVKIKQPEHIPYQGSTDHIEYASEPASWAVATACEPVGQQRRACNTIHRVTHSRRSSGLQWVKECSQMFVLGFISMLIINTNNIQITLQPKPVYRKCLWLGLRHMVQEKLYWFIYVISHGFVATL